jgi:type VI secretion system secreted protein VgrG
VSENGPYQHSRTATIETPLPLNTLVLRKFRYEDRLNRPFRIEADLLSDRASIPFEEIVGKRVRIRMQTRAGERLCHAVVASFDTCGMVDDLFAYRAVLVPWLWLLGRSADCRIFQGLSVPEIVSEILKENGFDEFELRIDEIDYPKLEYCVQYRETALNFVQRLLESEGIAYYFRHTETEAVLVLTDDPAAHDFAPGYEDVEFRQLTGGDTRTEHVHAWTVRRQVVPERFVTRDFDPVVPRQDFTHIGSTPDLDAVAMGSIYDYPGSVITRTQPGADKAKKKKGGNDRISHYHVERIAKVRLQEQQSAHKVAYAESTVRGFAAGVKFQLEGALRNEDDRPYLLTSVIMEWDAGHFRSGQAPQETFRCSTTAVDAELFWRPTRETPRPIIHGAQTAIVVGPKGEEIYVDQFGRVKVQFHWDRHHPDRDYNSSCWLRTSHPWAGKGFGGMAIPRIGQEVIVEFLEGDPDRPIINGRVYNGDSMPHASNSGRDGKPGNTKPDGIEQAAMMTSFKSNSLGGSGGTQRDHHERRRRSGRVVHQGPKGRDPYGRQRPRRHGWEQRVK